MNVETIVLPDEKDEMTDAVGPAHPRTKEQDYHRGVLKCILAGKAGSTISALVFAPTNEASRYSGKLSLLRGVRNAQERPTPQDRSKKSLS